MTLLTPEQQFMVDFNFHDVAAALDLPIPAEAAALMYGAPLDAITAYQAEIDVALARTADDFRDHAGVAALTALLPAGGSLLCIGDSITTYRYGYARLLDHLLKPRGYSVINRGFSGYTSTHGRELTYTQFLALQPDVVIVKYGVNDCKRFGGADHRTLVSAGEYRDNLRAIITAFQQHTSARVIVLTPTPVIESIVNTSEGFRAMRLIWQNTDLNEFAALALATAAEHDCIGVDLRSAVGNPPDTALFCADGLHPNPDGQRAMLQHLLAALANTA